MASAREILRSAGRLATRREFLVGVGATAATGALAVAGAEATGMNRWLPYWVRNLIEEPDCRGYAAVKYTGKNPVQEVRVSSPTGSMRAVMAVEQGKTVTEPVVGIGKVDGDATLFEVKIEKLDGDKVVEVQKQSTECGNMLRYTVQDLKIPE